MKHILKYLFWFGLQGMSARVLYQMPSTAICWSIYEFFKFVMGAHDNDSSNTTTATPNTNANPSNAINQASDI